MVKRIPRAFPEPQDLLGRSGSAATDDDIVPGSIIRLAGKDFYHLSNVLRLGVNRAIEIKSRNLSSTFRALIKEKLKDEYVLCISEIVTQQKKIPQIELYCGWIKPAKAENLVELCSSAGASKITFFPAEFSQHETKHSLNPNRIDRLQRIAQENAKQSGFLSICEVSYSTCLNSSISALQTIQDQHHFRLVLTPTAVNLSNPVIPLLKYQPLQNAIFCHETASETKAKIKNEQGGEPSVRCSILIGPEGGLSSSELLLAVESGFCPVSIGNKILRTEYAAFAASLLLMMTLAQD